MRKNLFLLSLFIALTLLCVSCGEQVEENDTNDVTLFNQGLLAVRKGDKWGYIDESFSLVIDLKFASACDFNEYGIAEVGERDSNGDILYGYIDIGGEYIVEPKFRYTKPFENGCAYVTEGDESYYINTKGEKIKAPEETDAEEKKDFEIYREGDKYGYKKPSEKKLTEAVYERASAFFCGYAAVKYEGKWGYINEKGKYYIEPVFDDASSFTEEGIARVKLGSKWGYIDTEGYFLIKPKFDTAEDFAPCGLACVSIDGKYGYIDKDGNYSITLQYAQAYSFDKYGYATISNDPPDKCWNFPCICDFYLINTEGKKMVKSAYTNYSSYSDGYIIAWDHHHNSEFEIVDKNGKVLLTEDDYDQVYGILYYLV